MSGPIQRRPRVSPDPRSVHYYVSKKTDRNNTQAHTHSRTKSQRLMLLSGWGMGPTRSPGLFACVMGQGSQELLSSRPKSLPGQRGLRANTTTASQISPGSGAIKAVRKDATAAFFHQLHSSEQRICIVLPEGQAQNFTAF